MKSLEIIVSCHDKNCTPRVKPGDKIPNNLVYIKHRTRDLERNIHIPFTLDVYLDVDNNNGISSLLIERWKLHYEVKQHESKEERASTVNKHIGIMIRTLYCYVRLLPSFQLSTKSRDCPISFRLYVSDLSVDGTGTDQFVTRTSSYNLPLIPTRCGNLSIRLKYIDANDIKSIYDMSDRMYKLDALHAFRNASVDPPRGEKIESVGSRGSNISSNISSDLKERYRGRRHSVAHAHEPIPIPNHHRDETSSDQHRRSLTSISVNTGSPPASNWDMKAGLRSPTQPSTSLVETMDEFPEMPSLNRHQSKSWSSTDTPFALQEGQPRRKNEKNESSYQQESVRQGTGIGRPNDILLSGRSRSLSKEGRGIGSLMNENRPRSLSRHGRPPQHPDGASSFTSSPGVSTPPQYYSNGSTPSAPFYIQPQSDFQSSGGNQYYSPQSISPSPPFHCPATNLLSTSPSTTVLGGIGLGSTMQNMRDYFISGGGRSRTLSSEKLPNKADDPVATADGYMTLSQLPTSPFDNASSLLQLGPGGENVDDPSGNPGMNTDGEKGNADIDGMFDFEESETLDEDEVFEDLPFAWAQQSTPDSYVFNKGGISHVPDLDDGSSLSGNGNISNLDSNNGSSSNGTLNLNQSFIAQQCMAPPMLLSFQQSCDDNSSLCTTESLNGSINLAFQKLDQMKKFHERISNSKSIQE